MTDHSALIERPCAATDQADLRDRIMNPNVAKSEAEWWASREIERLESALRDLTEWRDIADHDNSANEVLVMAEGWSKPIVAWRHHPSSRTDTWLSVPGAYRVKPSHFCPLPSALNQAKEAGE